MNGSQVIAESLVQLGVEHVFGIVGIPVIEVADACIARGIKFIGFRNEQSASYAASIYGYLSGKPGVCLTVGGPGVLHALAGVGNAQSNCFPLMLLAGSVDVHNSHKGGFQELDQVAAVTEYTKFAARPSTTDSLPFLLEKAYRTAYFGRPGATYVDLPANIIQSKDNDQVNFGVLKRLRDVPAPRSAGDPAKIAEAAALIRASKFPLLVIGKGAAYAKAEPTIRRFQDNTNIQFLPTPMGKGVISDSNPGNMSACRSQALKNADVVILVGTRLNWILHYGDAPKYGDNTKFIHIDVCAEELGNNAGQAELGILGDASLVIGQLDDVLKGWKAPALAPEIAAKRQKNVQNATKKEADHSVPLKYFGVFASIQKTIAEIAGDRKLVVVSEGANTMDNSRSVFGHLEPRTRLDAGTNATMGVGLGYAIAAKAYDPKSLVVAVEGDSAFGFSAIEVETAVRDNLPMVVYVMNNSGIYHGVDPARYTDGNPLPSTALSLDTRYDVLAESLGAKGYFVKDIGELVAATKDAVQSNQVCVINVIIESGKDRKLEFGWMASEKKKEKAKL